MKTLFLFLLLLPLLSVAFAEEFVMRTYYPAPNGRYQNMNTAGLLTATTINGAGAITGLTLTALGQGPGFPLTPGLLLYNGGNTMFSVDNAGNVLIAGRLNMSNGPIVNVSTLTAKGKIISATTYPQDAGGTLASKSYVDAKAPKINNGACYELSKGSVAHSSFFGPIPKSSLTSIAILKDTVLDPSVTNGAWTVVSATHVTLNTAVVNAFMTKDALSAWLKTLYDCPQCTPCFTCDPPEFCNLPPCDYTKWPALQAQIDSIWSAMYPAFVGIPEIRGTILDPMNQSGAWQYSGQTHVRIKDNVVLAEPTVRNIAGNSFDWIWPLVQACNGICSPNYVVTQIKDFWTACPDGQPQHHWHYFKCCRMQ